MKILPVGAELFHEDRRTVGLKDTTNLIASFRNFSNAPKNHLPTINRFYRLLQVIAGYSVCSSCFVVVD